MFDAAGLRPAAKVLITAGAEAQRHGANKWGVPKFELISTLDAALHSGVLRFAAALREAPALRDELRDFQKHTTAAGRATFSRVAASMMISFCRSRGRLVVRSMA